MKLRKALHIAVAGALMLTGVVLGTNTAVAAAEPVNVALTATPNASYTPSWNDIDKVNDGLGVNSGGPNSDVWATWDGTRPATHWLEYEWATPVTISRSSIMFWYDNTTNNGENVHVPASWKAQSWNANTSEWVDLAGVSAYGVAATGYNETTFTPVTTTKLRATFTAFSNAAGTLYSAIGVSEWGVYGEAGPVEPEEPVGNAPYAVDETHVRTTPGVVPTLPTTVTVTLADGARAARAVTWPAVTTTEVGTTDTSVTISGDLADTSVPASATIWVRGTASVEITAVEDAAALTTVGHAPALPATAIAVYGDGSKASDVAVTWAAVPPADYAEEGFFVVSGTVAGTTHTAMAFVIVDAAAAAPGTDTEAPVVTLTTDPVLGTGWERSAVTVTVTAEDNVTTSPAVEIMVDGAAWASYTAPIVISGQGLHTISARATDAAGNISVPVLADFKVDSIAPTTNLSTQESGTQVTFTLIGDDSVPGSGPDRIQYALGDGFWATYAAKFTVQKTAVPQTLEYASTDVAGNEEEHKFYTIAALAPSSVPSTTTLTLPAPTSAVGSTVPATITVTSTGTLTGGAVSILDGTTEVGTGTLAAGSATVDLMGLTVGTHVLTARFAGTAGVDTSTSAPVTLAVGFSDITSEHQFADEIAWLIDSGITQGFEDGTYRPSTDVSRLAMATFLYRLQNDGADAPACTAKPFSDVPMAHEACGEIAALSAQGIVKGFDNGTFRPSAAVSRDATAAFLYRIAHPSATTLPSCTVKPFKDVPMENQFCGAITWLVAEGITNGYADQTFKPAAAVKRDAMAAFLQRFSELD